MGKKLDALLGRGFKVSKFKATVNLAISRLAVLRNQHQGRCSVVRSDVVQILNIGQHEGALLRVEQVVKEQNMLDVYTMIEIYCYLLIQRVSLLEHAKECPEELKEAVSSLIYACSRCGEFPELHEIRAIFTTRFRKDFVSRAVQLRNNCGVNPKMIQKLSTRMPTTESRLKVLKEIAQENNIVLQLDEEIDSIQSEVKKDAENKQDEAIANELRDSDPLVDKLDVGLLDGLSDSVKMRRKYKDVAQAAQAAFESAAYAAVAARAAVELSRADSHDPDGDIPRTLRPRLMDGGLDEQMKMNVKKPVVERSISDSSVDSEYHALQKLERSSDEEEIIPEKNTIMFDDTDSETEDRGRVFLFGENDAESGNTDSLKSNEVIISQNENEIVEEREESVYILDKILKSESDYSVSEIKNQQRNLKEGEMHKLSINRAPVSVRTRRTYPRTNSHILENGSMIKNWVA